MEMRYPMDSRAAVAAAGLALVVGTGIVLNGREAPPMQHSVPATPSITNAEPTIEPEPTPKTDPPQPRPVPSRREAPGPLVLYASAGHLYAVEIGPRSSRPILIGMVDDQGLDSFTQGSPWTVPIHNGDTIDLVSRGERFGTRRIHADGTIQSAAVSADDRFVAVASNDDDRGGRVILSSTRRLSERRRVADFHTGSDGGGGAIHVFWNGPSGLTVVDICHCDGGAGYARTMAISLKGRVDDLEFLRDHEPYGPGPRFGSSQFAFDDSPSVDCWESEDACKNLPHSLTIADARRHTRRTLAGRRKIEFLSPQLSPNGTLVATSDGRVIEVYDVASKRVVHETSYANADLWPVAWLGDKHLIALTKAPNFVDDHDTGRLLLIELKPGEEYAQAADLVSGKDLFFVGWLR
jgi:hypothetical protein